MKPSPTRDTIVDFLVMIAVGWGVIIVIVNYAFPAEPVFVVDAQEDRL